MAKRKGKELNWQFDSRPLKVKNRPNVLMCRWRDTYHWKEDYKFALDLIQIGGLDTKLCAPKVAGVPILGISRFPLGSPWTKWHLSASPMAKHKVYYKEEGGGFPPSSAAVNLVSLCLPMARPCTKVLQLRINQFVIWFVQVRLSKWIISQSS
jgi:hypothetical protein